MSATHRKTKKERQLADGEGGGGGGGAKPYDGEKAWSSIHHSILSGANLTYMYVEYIVQWSILYRSDSEWFKNKAKSNKLFTFELFGFILSLARKGKIPACYTEKNKTKRERRREPWSPCIRLWDEERLLAKDDNKKAWFLTLYSLCALPESISSISFAFLL